MGKNLTRKEKIRLKNIWQKSSNDLKIIFDHYDMNFVLNLLNDGTDFIVQAVKVDPKEI